MGLLGDLSPQAGIAIGIIVGLCSTSIQSLGLTLQRKSHLLEEAKQQHEEQRAPYRRRRWQIGMFLFIVSNLVGSVIQITTLPLPVLSTLQASGLVFNTAFATLLLHEPFTRYSFTGTLLVCAGAVLIGIFGAVGEPAHNLQQLLDLLARYQFILWMAGTMLIVFVTFVMAKFLKYLSIKAHQQHEYSKEIERTEASDSPANGAFERRASSQRRPTLPLNIPVPNSLRASRLRMFRGMTYALISGILSAHSLLVAKSAVELVVRSLVPPRSNQFVRYQSWLILLALLFFALSQLYFLHRGLSHCSTSVLYPFVFCVYNVIAILDGLIYFNQSSRLSALDSGLVALGTFVLLAGVLSLSWRLDDIPPIIPSTIPAAIDSEAAVGLLADGEITPQEEASPSELSPLLPQKVRRRSTIGSLGGSDRRPTLSLLPPHLAPPSVPLRTPTSSQIWAELGDSDGDGDSVRSGRPSSKGHRVKIPRFNLRSPKLRRKRGHTLSSDLMGQSQVSFANLVDAEDHGPSRRSFGDLPSDRRSSAPVLGKPIDETAARPTSGSGSEADRDQEESSRESNRHRFSDETIKRWTTAPRRWAEWFYTEDGRNGGSRKRRKSGRESERGNEDGA